MYKRPKKKPLDQNAIPTTSLADMMFLLLIFFIMTTTLSRVTGFVSDMPAGSKAQQPTSDRTPLVMLHNDRITVDDKEISLPALEKYLKGLRLDLRQGDAKVVVLSTSGEVKYQTYYATMSMIQGCGGIVALQSEDAGGK
jgi:biopolymer transport protein ExbD